MSELSGLFADMYNKFVLRDFVGKIIPGGVLLFSMTVMFWSPEQVYETARAIPVIGIVFLAGLLWTVTLGAQCFGELVHVWNYFPPTVTFKEGTLRVAEFQRSATDPDKLQYERFVVIKEACGNLLVAVLLSIPAWIFVWVSPWSNPWSDYTRQAIVLAVGVTILFGLRRMHRQHVERQWMFATSIPALGTAGQGAPASRQG